MFFQSRADKLFDQGINYLDREQYSEAVKAFSQVIEIDGASAKNVVAYVNRGYAYLSMAIDSLSVNDGDKSNRKEWLGQAINDFSNALHIFTFQVERSGQALDAWADAYFKRANAYFYSEMPTEAINDLNEAIKIRGKNPDYYIRRGFIYAEWIGDASTGLEDYSRALAISPSAEGYLYRSMAHFDLGDLDKAKSDFHSAVRLNPDVRNVNRGFTAIKYRKWEGFKETL